MCRVGVRLGFRIRGLCDLLARGRGDRLCLGGLLTGLRARRAGLLMPEHAEQQAGRREQPRTEFQ